MSPASTGGFFTPKPQGKPLGGFTFFFHDEGNETGKTLWTCLKVSGDDGDNDVMKIMA